MDLADGVWMVFATKLWLGCVIFDMGYDSAEYKGAGLYVCVPCINDDRRSGSDAPRTGNGCGSLFGSESLNTISAYLSPKNICKKIGVHRIRTDDRLNFLGLLLELLSKAIQR